MQTPEQQKTEPDDIDLVHRAQAGDLIACEGLVRRYHRQIYTFVYGLTGSREEAEALAQETFVKAWKGLGHFHEKIGFYVWIYRIALHRSAKSRAQRQDATFDEFDSDVKTTESYREFSSKGSLLRKMSLSEFQAKMNSALLKLSHKHRAAVILREVQEMSCVDIARVMHGSERRVQSRLLRATRQLSAELAADGVGEAGASPLNVSGLLAFKKYERPDAVRLEKNIQATLREIRSTSNAPTLLLFPDKSFAWMFTQPRYGIAALFVVFIGMNLIDHPIRVDSLSAIKVPNEEIMAVVETNQTKAVVGPSLAPTVPSPTLDSAPLSPYVK